MHTACTHYLAINPRPSSTASSSTASSRSTIQPKFPTIFAPMCPCLAIQFQCWDMPGQAWAPISYCPAGPATAVCLPDAPLLLPLASPLQRWVIRPDLMEQIWLYLSNRQNWYSNNSCWWPTAAPHHHLTTYTTCAAPAQLCAQSPNYQQNAWVALKPTSVMLYGRLVMFCP